MSRGELLTLRKKRNGWFTEDSVQNGRPLPRTRHEETLSEWSKKLTLR